MKQPSKAQRVREMVVGIRDLQKGEYYVVNYTRGKGPDGHGYWAYRTFRSKRSACAFAVVSMVHQVPSKVKIFDNGHEVKA